MESLYTRFRPRFFDEVIGQESVKRILRQQLNTGNIFNCMIFAGTSGTGKTTLARIFANGVNKGQGFPLEIDAASNNGVDNVRQIISSAAERSLNSEYKVYIIDEAHMLTTQAWNAFLKCIEEPPRYTIFIFCTTDPQKIPNTIQNRCMRFNFTRVSSSLIEQKLSDICVSLSETADEMAPTNWGEAVNYISRICDGEVRKAISMLETCISYNENLAMENVIAALGNSAYEDYFTLVNGIIDGNNKILIETIDKMYDSGVDLKKFVDLFTEFCLDIVKYILSEDISSTKIPNHLEDKVKFSIGFDNAIKYYNYIVDKLLNLKNMIKNSTSEKVVIEIVFNQMGRFI